ncbi:MFS transporter small subunit [Kocuria rhizosphaerae]
MSQVRIALGWILVTVPLAYGVWQTGLKIVTLFSE